MKKRFYQLLAVGLSVVMLTGCGSSKSDSMYATSPSKGFSNGAQMADTATAEEYYYDEKEYNGTDAFTGNAYDTTTTSAVQMQERKLIKTVDLNVETKEYNGFMANIDSQVAKFGGYIEYMDSYNGSKYQNSNKTRTANMTIRVPQSKLTDFLNSVSDICNVVRRNDSVNDVTLSYVDTESRRDALKIEQERLLDLLEKAENLQSIFTIEERLTTVRYQLESMESQLRSLDNKVTYSTVTISVSEVKELTPVVEEEKTRWQEIGEGFIESIQSICESFLDFVVWFLINIPFFLIWGIVITVFVLIVKKIRKKHTKKTVKAEEKNESSETDEK